MTNPRYRLVLEVVGDGDPDYRLKLALKSLWRRWRLRCRHVSLVPTEPAAPDDSGGAP